MKILGGKYGGNPLRVAYFLAEKGIDIPFEPVDILGGAHRSDTFTNKNPFREVPVLELDDGTCLSETMAICRYFERLQPQPNLMGDGALEEATIEMWCRRIEFQVYYPARWVLRHSEARLKALEPVQIPQWADVNRERLSQSLVAVDNQLAVDPWIAGERFTVADINLLFAVEMMAHIGLSAEAAGAHIGPWFARLCQRPAIAQIREEVAASRRV